MKQRRGDRPAWTKADAWRHLPPLRQRGILGVLAADAEGLSAEARRRSEAGALPATVLAWEAAAVDTRIAAAALRELAGLAEEEGSDG